MRTHGASGHRANRDAPTMAGLCKMAYNTRLLFLLSAPHMPPQDTPRWYFGWNIVAAATVLTLLTVGMRLGIGPLFLPMAKDLGFSRSLLDRKSTRLKS